MANITFNSKVVNLWQLAEFTKLKKINHSEILSKAFDQKVLFAEEKHLLEKFINFIKNKKMNSSSQIFQDIFAEFIIGENFNKTFLEFGATNGVDLSNTLILEKELGWNGVLAEPSPQWHKDLEKNRPNTKIIKECIWKSTGDILEFFVSQVGELSTIKDFVNNDIKSMPKNTEERNKDGNVIKVKTVSLNDVVENYFNGTAPSYISVDTEGSELDILTSFDFKKYRPIVFTVEHNFTELQLKIDELMKKNGYYRVFNKITLVDAWYVSKEVLNKMYEF